MTIQGQEAGTALTFRYTDFFENLLNSLERREENIRTFVPKSVSQGMLRNRWLNWFWRDLERLERRAEGMHEWIWIANDEQACLCGLVRESWMETEPDLEDPGHVVIKNV